MTDKQFENLENIDPVQEHRLLTMMQDEYPPLTEKQQKFAETFAETGQVKKSAIEAGYSPNTASQIGQILLQKPHVAMAIRQRRELLAASLGIEPSDILQEMAAIAFSDISQVCEFDDDGVSLKPSSELSPFVLKGISKVKMTKTKFGNNVHVEMHDKIRALEKLGTFFGLWSEPGEEGGDNGRIDPNALADKVVSKLARLAATRNSRGDNPTTDSGGAESSGSELEVLGP